MTDWYQLAPDQVAAELGSNSRTGLDQSEVADRRTHYGPNELHDLGGRSAWAILTEQLFSAMIALLFVAATVSIYLGEYKDAVAIVAIIVLNAALGFAQDFRAEKALAALKRYSVPNVKVWRGGAIDVLPARELVPGDLVALEVGNLVPADCRILQSTNLRIQEAALTGESEPVDKSITAIDSAVPMADRTNMAYLGTTVAFGHGQAMVTNTGMTTELGKIAHSLQTVRPKPTPLQTRLGILGRSLALTALGIVAVVYILGIVAGADPRVMLLTSLSLAVAVVPEGLPAVATVALAIGARRMFRRQALIRKLPAVETLGSVTVICSDKTGTLTENRMSVTVLDIAGHRLDLTEHLRDDDQGTAIAEGSTSRTTDSCPRIDPDDPQQLALALLLAGAGLCNDAELKSPKQGEPWKAVGEPTEAALILAAARLGLPKGELNENFPRVDELPFDSDRKRMTTVHVVKPTHCEGPGYRRSAVTDVLAHLGDVERIAFMKGAVDSVLSCCEYYWEQGAPEELDDESRARIVAANDQLAAMGMRVMGVSFRPLDDLGLARSDATDHDEVRPAPPRETEEAHIFVGLIGMIDPPRPEVRDAVIRCRQAGIRPLMITGDHPLTAQHIAQQLGIANGKPVVHGTELAAMDARQMEQRAASTSVFARVAPQDKLSIVQALQKQGHVVAMTGDGVNDAPALKQSHIGVAMGRTGTDVSKEASDMILLDDNFATIVNAVEEGRIVYDNIRKFVRYTMTSNAGEVWVMVIGPLLGMPLPLLPLQILWVNLVTDGLPGLALAVEPAERETMHRAPYPPTENVMGRGMWRDIAWIGVLMGAVSMLMGFLYWYHGFDAAYWRTVVFTVLTLSQLGNVMAIRAERDSLFQIGVFSNLALVGAVALTIVLQFAVIYIPWLQSLLKTAPLSLRDLLFCLLASTIVFWSVELKKFLRRHPTYASSDS